MTPERDAVVVGAGPCGAAAATALVQKGLDVLLLDRQQFPRDKVCGDNITGEAVELLFKIGMEEKIRDADFYPIRSFLLSSPRGYVIESVIRDSGRSVASSYVVPRIEFDLMVQQHAIESGAEFQVAHVTGPVVENGLVTGVRIRSDDRDEIIRSRVVIGADGVSSVIAKGLDSDKHESRHRAVALRTYIDDIAEQSHRLEFYLPGCILPGYAWIFHSGSGRANLGLGMRLDKLRRSDRSLEELLELFLDMPIIRERLPGNLRPVNISAGQLNLGSQNIQRAFDGALLVGDAAGLVNPLSGGGIRNGLESALIAADVIKGALEDDDVSLNKLGSYDRAIRAVMWTRMRRSHMLQRSMLRFPGLVDLLIRYVGSNRELTSLIIRKFQPKLGS
jgi:geranylgeranyl reductase family protein